MLTTRYPRVEEEHMQYSKLMSRPVTGDAVIFMGSLRLNLCVLRFKGLMLWLLIWGTRWQL